MEKIKWDVYRVKKEFALGTIMWPIGSVRFWTAEEARGFRQALSERNNMGVEATQAFFDEHLEVVYWNGAHSL